MALDYCDFQKAMSREEIERILKTTCPNCETQASDANNRSTHYGCGSWQTSEKFHESITCLRLQNSRLRKRHDELKTEVKLANAHLEHWPSVATFAGRMRKRLDANVHKVGDDASVPWLFSHMMREASEICEALFNPQRGVSEERTTSRVLDELADLANFAMMIGDSLTSHVEKEPETHEFS